MALRKATKAQTTACIALVSVAGCGKTYTALRIASRLAMLRGSKRVALLDCEHDSAEKFAGDPNPDGGMFDFDVESLRHFAVDNYLKPMAEIVKDGGHSVTILDTISHAWTHPGGILDIVDRAPGKSKFSGGWKVATPEHQRFVEGLLGHPLDLICSMRAKEKYVLEENAKGKMEPRRVGLAPVQRDNISHEFDLVLSLDVDHLATVVKSRVLGIGIGDTFEKPGADLADIIFAWLSDGISLEERQELIDDGKRERLMAAPKTWKPADETRFLTFLEGIGARIDDVDAFCVSLMRPKPGAGAILPKLENHLRDPEGPGRREYEDFLKERAEKAEQDSDAE